MRSVRVQKPSSENPRINPVVYAPTYLIGGSSEQVVAEYLHGLGIESDVMFYQCPKTLEESEEQVVEEALRTYYKNIRPNGYMVVFTQERTLYEIKGILDRVFGKGKKKYQVAYQVERAGRSSYMNELEYALVYEKGRGQLYTQSQQQYLLHDEAGRNYRRVSLYKPYANGENDYSFYHEGELCSLPEGLEWQYTKERLMGYLKTFDVEIVNGRLYKKEYEKKRGGEERHGELTTFYENDISIQSYQRSRQLIKIARHNQNYAVPPYIIEGILREISGESAIIQAVSDPYGAIHEAICNLMEEGYRHTYYSYSMHYRSTEDIYEYLLKERYIYPERRTKEQKRAIVHETLSNHPEYKNSGQYNYLSLHRQQKEVYERDSRKYKRGLVVVELMEETYEEKYHRDKTGRYYDERVVEHMLQNRTGLVVLDNQKGNLQIIFDYTEGVVTLYVCGKVLTEEDCEWDAQLLHEKQAMEKQGQQVHYYRIE